MAVIGFLCASLRRVRGGRDWRWWSYPIVEQTFALLHQFKRLAVRWEQRLDMHEALASFACGLICWRRPGRQRARWAVRLYAGQL